MLVAFPYRKTGVHFSGKCSNIEATARVSDGVLVNPCASR
jgi:hypothetical protein